MTITLDKHAELARNEQALWQKFYGTGKVVLDVGAGEGETAELYLSQGAEQVICIEADPAKIELLKRNFPGPNVIAIQAKLDHGKIDIDGGELGWLIETHDFPMRLKVLWRDRETRLCRLEYNPWNIRYRLRRLKWWAAHWIRVNILK